MTQSFRKLLTVKVALYFVILYIVYATKLTNLEERIITWHKTRLSAFPIRVFKISAEKVQKHERTIINAYRIKFEFLGFGGIYKLCWQGFWLFLTTCSPTYVYIFYLIIVDKKSTFLDYLPTSSCQHSLWVSLN